MITQNAIVTKIENQQVWIENQQTTACSSCLQKESCTSSILARYLPKRTIAVHSSIPLKPGDKVVVGIDEKQLIKATLLLYMLPLIMMFLAAGVSSWLILAQQAWIILTSIAGLLLSFYLINKLQYTLFLHTLARPEVIHRAGKNTGL